MTIDDKVAQSIRCFCVSYETGKHSRLALLQRARRRRMVGAREDGDPEKEDGRKATNNDRQNNKCGSEVGTVGGPRGRGGGRRHAMSSLWGPWHVDSGQRRGVTFMLHKKKRNKGKDRALRRRRCSAERFRMSSGGVLGFYRIAARQGRRWEEAR